MSNHTPSQEGLKYYREQHQAETKRKILEAIDDLKLERKDVNICTVAKKAEISTVTLYKYKDLVENIRNIRDKRKPPQLKKYDKVGLEPLRVINDGLQLKVEELQMENGWLKKRIEFQNGQIHELRTKINAISGNESS